jgi:hypothetical protein
MYLALTRVIEKTQSGCKVPQDWDYRRAESKRKNKGNEQTGLILKRRQFTCRTIEL